jgi:signal peptidase I
MSELPVAPEPGQENRSDQPIGGPQAIERQTSAPANVPARYKGALITTIVWLRDLMLSVLIAVLIILFLYRPVKVEGTSMMPNLLDQERLFINQYSYKFGGDIHRGDTVVFWFPLDTTKSFIKRVIAIPGDTVSVKRGTVVVNGKPLEESYIPLEYRDTMSMPSELIPKGFYFVLGDHRSSSYDSRMWGLVPKSYIYGKAVFVFWPFHDLGSIR